MALSKPTNVAAYVEEMLQCSVCLDTVKEPHTLQNCLHTFCKECADQLQHKQNNQPPGVKCPLCGQFSGKDEIRHNFFVKDLVEMHRTSEKAHKECEQCHIECGTNQASWKCLDCRMVMCDICKNSHLRIKLLQGHRLIPLSEDTAMVIDQLVFCTIHQDKPIELYCEPCKLPICMKCKVTKHNTHETETIEEVLEKLVPEIQENTKYIEEYIKANEKSSNNIDGKINEITKAFKTCHKEVDKLAEGRIKEIKATQKDLKDKLNQQEKKEIKKLKDIKDELDKKQKEGENLKKVVLTSLDKARHATLLNELVKGGLQDKLKTMSSTKRHTPMECPINIPNVEPNIVEWNKLKQVGLLGTLVMKMSSIFIAMGMSVVQGEKNVRERYWFVSFKKFFSKPIQQILQINLPSECSKLLTKGDDIWVPMHNGKVDIYSKTGKKRKTISIAHSRSVEKAHNGDVFIACDKGSGLHVISDNDNPVKLCDGSFSDVCSFMERVYALEYTQKSILEFCHDNETESTKKTKWKQVRKITLSGYATSHYLDTIVVTISTKDNNVKYFYVSSWNTNTIYRYNEQGQQIQQFGRNTTQSEGKLSAPYLCCVDSDSHILVADSWNKKLKFLDPESKEWSDTGVTGQRQVYDAKLDSDGALWLAQYNGSTHIITKHVHTSEI